MKFFIGKLGNVAKVMIKDGFSESRINTIGLAMGKKLASEINKHQRCHGGNPHHPPCRI